MADDRAEIVPWERVPAVGDVLAVTPLAALKVLRVRGHTVWLGLADVDRGPLGAEWWEFVPPARWRGSE